MDETSRGRSRLRTANISKPSCHDLAPLRQDVSAAPVLRIFMAVALALAPAAASADTVWIGEPTANPIKAVGVKVQSVDGGNVTYTTASGASSSKPLSQLQLINIDGETSFDSAENAFVARSWDEAITGYQSVLQSSSKDWIKNRSALRLSLAAKQVRRFDAEVSAYVALLLQNSTAAAAAKPSKPPENSPYLDTAANRINQALGNSQMNNSQKTALLGLELDIYRAKKDTANVNQTLQQLSALGGGSPADAGMLKIAAANVAYDARQYTQAINDIDQNRGMFTEPDQQVDALYVLAQAREAVDGNKTDPTVLKDLALSYMRVVTFGGQLPDKPHVPESLFRMAQLEEKLKDATAAGQLYRQIIKSYPASSVAADARAAVAKVVK